MVKDLLQRFVTVLLAGALVWSSVPSYAGDENPSIMTYHGRADRSGHFIVKNLTWKNAHLLRLDESFRPQVSGHIYAQPLYWTVPGTQHAMLLIATQDNHVYAIDAVTGASVWMRSLGKSVALSSLSCGNIDPLGVTGTPVIDEATKAIYLDAMVEKPSGPRHLVFALSLKDGSSLPGWPVDVGDAIEGSIPKFIPRDQNQRGALAILGQSLYIPFGGHTGDCGQYHGFIIGISLLDPKKVVSWGTRARGGGIWAPGGLSTDGVSLFAATGNTFEATDWSDGEAVFRFKPDLKRSNDTRDFFAPLDWLALDAKDADLGGTNPILLDVPAESGSRALILALGKDGKAYLLDRGNLGGMGGALLTETVARGPIITAPAAYPTADGVFVAFYGLGTNCPTPSQDMGIVMLKISSGPGSNPMISTAWCAPVRGSGSPIVTTSDGRTDPIVWIAGAEGDNQLHGFKGDTGEPLFSGPHTAMAGLRHLQTLIATQEQLYIAADNKIYAFKIETAPRDHERGN